jgi:hypothetical protein
MGPVAAGPRLCHLEFLGTIQTVYQMTHHHKPTHDRVPTWMPLLALVAVCVCFWGVWWSWKPGLQKPVPAVEVVEEIEAQPVLVWELANGDLVESAPGSMPIEVFEAFRESVEKQLATDSAAIQDLQACKQSFQGFIREIEEEKWRLRRRIERLEVSDKNLRTNVIWLRQEVARLEKSKADKVFPCH